MDINSDLLSQPHASRPFPFRSLADCFRRAQPDRRRFQKRPGPALDDVYLCGCAKPNDTGGAEYGYGCERLIVGSKASSAAVSLCCPVPDLTRLVCPADRAFSYSVPNAPRRTILRAYFFCCGPAFSLWCLHVCPRTHGCTPAACSCIPAQRPIIIKSSVSGRRLVKFRAIAR